MKINNHSMKVNSNSMHDAKNDFVILDAIKTAQKNLALVEDLLVGRIKADFWNAIERGDKDNEKRPE